MDKSVANVQIAGKSKSLVNQHRFHHYTAFLFILKSLLFFNRLLCSKKLVSCWCKLYSLYEEIPEEFLDETDIDSYFYHNILDSSQTDNRIVRIRKGSNKKSFAFKVFLFCDSKLQQRFILEEEVSISKKEIESLLDSLGEFLKAFDQANKVSQIPLPKPKFEIGFTKAEDELFTHCYKDIVELLNRQIRLSFRFEKNKTCVFSIKKLNNTVINSFLQKLSTWVTAKSNISTRIDFLLLTSVTFLRAITICSAFTPDCEYDNSTIILIGDVYCPNTKCLGELCKHKRLLNLSAEAIINGRNARLYERCAIFFLKTKQIPFSCLLVMGFTFLKTVQNQFKMLLEIIC